MGQGGGGYSALAAWLLVGGAVAWTLISFRATLREVSYLDDSAIHQQMVRFATLQWRHGHLPLTSWYPYLGLGSPQFLHYQSLPAMLTGAAGIVVGPDFAYRLTLWLLMGLWPISVYLGARLLGLRRGAAAAAGAMAPFLMSPTQIAYEPRAYVWIGYGVWTQLWASMTLPLAWGCTWRAIRGRGAWMPAVALIALTTAFHFETGYLALFPLVLLPLVAGRPILVRVGRAAALALGAAAALAWVIVPLIANRNWASVNEVFQQTGLVNGYGTHVLSWLFTGELLDNGRLPTISLLALLGGLFAIVRWRRDPVGRALLVLALGCLALSMGRSTFGSLVAVIPGNRDLFFRRFEMGLQLSCLMLGGLGAQACLAAGRRAFASLPARWAPAGRRARGWRRFAPLGAIAPAVLVLAPAWTQTGTMASNNALGVSEQQASDHSQGRQMDRLLATLARQPAPGRVYAGDPSNWGTQFTVGQVPVFKYLAARDVDEVGFTLRTASLMTQPEFHFDATNASDYILFGIRYLILPRGWEPPVPARRVARSGPYGLWQIPGGGYVHTGEIAGRLGLDRTDAGARSVRLLQSDWAARGLYQQAAYGHPEVPSTFRAPGGSSRSDHLTFRPPTRAGSPVGTVSAEQSRLTYGKVRAQLRMREAGIAVLSVSFDPGWRATVDGHPVPTFVVAPALVGIRVGAGQHKVAFAYHGYGGYPLLVGLALISLAGLLVIDLRRRREAPVPGPPRT